MLVEVVGIGMPILGVFGEEQVWDGIADGLVGHCDRAWVDVDLDGRMAGNLLLGGKTTSDQV